MQDGDTQLQATPGQLPRGSTTGWERGQGEERGQGDASLTQDSARVPPCPVVRRSPRVRSTGTVPGCASSYCQVTPCHEAVGARAAAPCPLSLLSAPRAGLIFSMLSVCSRWSAATCPHGPPVPWATRPHRRTHWCTCGGAALVRGHSSAPPGGPNPPSQQSSSLEMRGAPRTGLARSPTCNRTPPAVSRSAPSPCGAVQSSHRHLRVDFAPAAMWHVGWSCCFSEPCPRRAVARGLQPCTAT